MSITALHNIIVFKNILSKKRIKHDMLKIQKKGNK